MFLTMFKSCELQEPLSKLLFGEMIKHVVSNYHYENMSVQYEAISKSGKNIFRCKNVTFFLFLLKT